MIPGSGRSAGEGIGYSLQYSWASLVAQLVKNCLQCGRPAFGLWLGEGKGYLLQYSGLENSMECIVHGVTLESDMTEQLSLSLHFSKSLSRFIFSHEHGLSLLSHSLQLCSIFNRFYTYFVRFMVKYFILRVGNISSIMFLISNSICSFLVCCPSSVAQLCPPGFPVLHLLPELAPTYVH